MPIDDTYAQTDEEIEQLPIDAEADNGLEQLPVDDTYAEADNVNESLPVDDAQQEAAFNEIDSAEAPSETPVDVPPTESRPTGCRTLGRTCRCGVGQLRSTTGSVSYTHLTLPTILLV